MASHLRIPFYSPYLNLKHLDMLTVAYICVWAFDELFISVVCHGSGKTCIACCRNCRISQVLSIDKYFTLLRN